MGFKAFIKAFLGFFWGFFCNFLGHFNGLFVKFWGIKILSLIISCKFDLDFDRFGWKSQKRTAHGKPNKKFLKYLFLSNKGSNISWAAVFFWKITETLIIITNIKFIHHFI